MRLWSRGREGSREQQCIFRQTARSATVYGGVICLASSVLIVRLKPELVFGNLSVR